MKKLRVGRVLNLKERRRLGSYQKKDYYESVRLSFTRLNRLSKLPFICNSKNNSFFGYRDNSLSAVGISKL